MRQRCTLVIVNGVQKNTGANVLAPDRIEVDGLDDCDEPPGNVEDVFGGEEGLLEFARTEADAAVIIVDGRLNIFLDGNR